MRGEVLHELMGVECGRLGHGGILSESARNRNRFGLRVVARFEFVDYGKAVPHGVDAAGIQTESLPGFGTPPPAHWMNAFGVCIGYNRRMRDLELLVCDINGVPRGKSVNGTSFGADSRAQLPLAVFFQCITGDYADEALETYCPNDEDLLLRPDWATCGEIPWKTGDSRQVVCETLDKTGEPVPFDPRNVLKRIIGRYAAKGLTPVVAPELEFYLLKPPKRADMVLVPASGVDERAEFGGEAYSSDALDKYAPVLDEVRAMSARIDIPLQAMVHELGPGQVELNIAHDHALIQADRLFLLKRLVKACALRRGHLASFMAKPIMELPGSGLHLHVSLVDEQGVNLFALKDGKASAALRQFIGGLQTYLPPAFALIAPHVNSYRRFVSGSSAPINLSWGYDNRTTGFRVPYAEDDSQGRVESRVAGADANPYLFVAATLACGLLGLAEEIEPSQPFSGDAYDVPANLPENLHDALRTLAAHNKLAQLLSRRFIDGFVSVKRRELRHLGRQVTPWEVGFLGSLL